MPPLLVQRVEEFARENLSFHPNATIVVAISGGADSTALLHILNESSLKLHLVAVYIDHGLRPDETGDEIAFVQHCTERLGIELLARPVDVRSLQRERKCSPEEAARKARYDELERIRKEYQADFIAVAHTADDQAEEFLIRLIRGTGLKGLSGMTPVNGRIVRPLLAETKSSLIEYLAAKDLGFCHDSSNDERIFLRNKVRLDLLPLLEEHFNPAIRNTLLQTMAILKQDEELLAKMSEERFQELTCLECDEHNRVQRLHLNRTCSTEHPAIQRRILEMCCWKMDNRPTFRTIYQLQELIENGINGAQLHLAEGLRVHLTGETLEFFYPQGKVKFRGDGGTSQAAFIHQIEKPGNYLFNELGKELSLEFCDRSQCDFDFSADNTLFANADRLHFPLSLRSVKPGEKFRSYGSPGRKKIARILSDMKIRAEIRRNYPLLTYGELPIALVGAKLADDFKVTSKTKKLLVIRWRDI